MTNLFVDQFDHEYVRTGYKIPDPIEEHTHCDGHSFVSR